MTTLKAGDIRKKGDEVRTKWDDPNFAHLWDKRGSSWRKTDLIGEPIMESDLMHLEFRRP